MQQLENTAFLRYVFYNIESSFNSAAPRWMDAYASLVQDEALRTRFHGTIMAEHALTREHLTKLFGKPLEERRPRFWKTLKAREVPLQKLHRQQIELLVKMRGEKRTATRNRRIPIAGHQCHRQRPSHHRLNAKQQPFGSGRSLIERPDSDSRLGFQRSP